MRCHRLGSPLFWLVLTGCAPEPAAPAPAADAGSPPGATAAQVVHDLPPAPPVQQRARPGRRFSKSAAELLDLHGEAFARGVDTFSVDDAIDDPPALLWQVLQRVEAERDSWRWSLGDLRYGRIAEALLARGTRADFDRMLEIYDRLPDDSRRRTELIRPLVDYRIRQHLAALAGTPRPALAQHAAPEIPARLAGTSAELQDAWRAWRSTLTSAASASAMRPTIAGAPIAPPTLTVAVSALLHEASGDHVASIARFPRSGGCVRTSEAREPQNLAAFLALLVHRRHAEALATLLRSPAVFKRRGLSSDQAGWVREYLDWWGVDAVALHAGAAADGNYGHHAPVLAAAGGDRAARYLIALGGVLEQPYERASHLGHLAVLVEPGPRGHPLRRPEGARPVSASVQGAALGEIVRAVRPDADPAILDAASQVLAELRRPESKPALRMLAQVPLEKARREASDALRKLGERAPALPPARPVRFLILVNGAPLDGHRLSWAVEYPGGRSMSRTEMVQSGLLQIDRDHFSGRAPSRVLLERRRMESWQAHPPEGPEALWFKVAVGPPTDLDATTVVEVRTGGLIVSLAGPSMAGGTMRVSLARTGELWRTEGFRQEHVGSFELPAAASVTFASLPEGRYEVAIWGTGSRYWVARDVVVGEGVTTVAAESD